MPRLLQPVHREHILLLRLVLIGLAPLALAALGLWVAEDWAAASGLALVGVLFSTWMYLRTIIRPLAAAAADEKQLQQRLSLLQAVLDTAPMTMAIKDTLGHYLLANAGYAAQYSLNEAQMLGQTDEAVAGPDAARRMRDSDQLVLQTGETLTYRALVQIRQRWRQMETTKYPVRDRDGALIGVGQVATDVTELAASQEKFARVFHACPDWIIITRLDDGRVLEANEGFERISGYSRSETLGKPIGQFKVWGHPAQRASTVERLRRDGALRDVLVQLRRRDGSIIDCMVSASLIALEGNSNDYAVWIARDVTEARSAERALRESETRFASLFEQSPLPMAFAFDSDGFQVFHRNEAWHTAFGVSRAQSQGKSAVELGLWANTADAVEFHRLTLLRQPINEWTTQWICTDGSSRWISIFGRFIVEPHRTMLVTTFMDITEQRRARQEVLDLNAQLESRVSDRTQQLQAANAELQQTLQTLGQTKDHLVQSEKLASLGALVAGVAHELNTPIGNGLTVASTLEEKAQQFVTQAASGLKRSALDRFVADTQFACDILVRNLTRAGTLINSFKQVAVDQTSSQRREFELFEVVSEIVITLNPAIRKSSCRVIPDIERGMLLDSYPGPLGQVLTNLINNALIHAFDVGQHGTVEIMARPLDAQEIEIVVRDNGRGIEASHLKRIFDPFFTTRLGQGGSGLGLHIVHNIVTGALGGRIEVESAPGQGAQFVLHLPLKAPALDSAE